MWARWVAFTSRTETGTTLAAFRVAIGLCLALNVAMVLRADLVDALWVDVAHGGMSALQPGWLVTALGGATPAVMRPLAWVTLGSGLVLAAGFGGRLTAFAALQLLMATADVNPLAGGSYDELLQNALWLCVLGDTTATHSVDCRLRTGSWTSDRPVGLWARYLVVFQLVLMCASTGAQKVSAYWTPGGDFSALYYILQQPGWQRGDMRWLAHPALFPLTQLGTAVSWVWEVTAPVWGLAFHARATPGALGRFGALCTRLRLVEVYAGLGVVFHVTVAALMDVGPFTPITLAFYLALVPPEAWGRLRARILGAPHAAPAPSE